MTFNFKGEAVLLKSNVNPDPVSSNSFTSSLLILASNIISALALNGITQKKIR